MKTIAAAGVAALLALGLLFGGVLADENGTPRAELAPALDPVALRDREAALSRLLAGFSTGDTAASVRELEQAVAARPADVESLTLLGLAYQQRARETGDPTFYSLSETSLERALDLQPEESLALTGLASLAVTRHRFADGLALARRALERSPDDAAALGALGDALLSLGRYEEAFAAFDRMSELAPGVGSFARVAYARELLGRPEGAVEALEYAFELRLDVPEYEAWARVQLGNLQFGLGRLVEAERSYRAALARMPDYVHAEAGLARVEAARGDLARAAERLERVVEVLPLPQYATWLGDVLGASSRPSEAAAAYDLVGAIDRLQEANGVRTDLQGALFDLDHDRDVAAALERARAAYREAPGVTAADVLAWALYKNGRCEEARGYSAQALRLGTRDALMLFHRGLIERCAGDEEAARRYLRRALALNASFSILHAPTAQAALAELEA